MRPWPALPSFNHPYGVRPWPALVARAPTGEFVVYLTHYPGDASDCPICNCTTGSSFSGEAVCGGECGGGKNKTLFSYFTSSHDPDGQAPHPWTELTSLCAVQMGGVINCSVGGNAHVDMNLAPVIRGDGSMLAWTRYVGAYQRGCGGVGGWHCLLSRELAWYLHFRLVCAQQYTPGVLYNCVAITIVFFLSFFL